MPTPTDSDTMPAWLKGDLPPEPRPDEAESLEGGPPAAAHTGDASPTAADATETVEEAADAVGPDAEAAAAPEAFAGDVVGEAPEVEEDGGVEAPAEADGESEAPPKAEVADAPEAEAEIVMALLAEDGQPGAPAATAAAVEPNAESAHAMESADQADNEAVILAQPADLAVMEDAAEHAPTASMAEAMPGPRPYLEDDAPPRAAPEPAPPLTLPQVEPLNLEALVEALLFVADGAATVGQLAEALEVHAREIEAALEALADSYRRRGLSLQRFRDKVQLTTAPAAAAAVERFLGLAAATPLSRAALESLAIIAYQQPVTRPQIEAVRGVNSDSVIKNLLSKGLIEESGRAEGPGRPVLYSTTPEFMQHFGLSSLAELPPLALAEAGTPVPTQDSILKG